VDVGRRVLLSLSLGVDDAGIAGAALSAAKLGLDCPLGWPDDFLRFLQAYQAGRVVPPQDVAGRDWRRRLGLPGNGPGRSGGDRTDAAQPRRRPGSR